MQEIRIPDSDNCYLDLIKTSEMNYYQIKKELPQGYRMSTADEELKIQFKEEKAKKDLRKAEAFAAFFPKDKPDNYYCCQWTETGLRVPKGWEKGKFETDNKGRKYWPRIVLIGDREVGEAFIPEGIESVVVEWNEYYGLPKETRIYKPWSRKPLSTYFIFDVLPRRDKSSGYHDVAIGRGGGWVNVGEGGCLGISAYYGRWDAISVNTFRPIRMKL